MNQEERLTFLIQYFLSEDCLTQTPPVPHDVANQKILLRGLMNKRPPCPLPTDILQIQNMYLKEELRPNITSLSTLQPIKPYLYLWQGDITTFGADAIVNAANRDMLGCFHPNHKCIDNAIHSFAGVQLRLACHEIMEQQGKPEIAGNAKLTPAFNLPSNHIIHTVGPIVRENLEEHHKIGLENCYLSCLKLGLQHDLTSIVFCCISTGEYHFPHDIACQIAVNTVCKFLKKHHNPFTVVFNVFNDEDFILYKNKLSSL